MPSVALSYCYAECHYAECHHAECHHAECHYSECHYAECQYSECHYAKCRYVEYLGDHQRAPQTNNKQTGDGLAGSDTC